MDSALAGRLIGKAGETVKKMRDTSGAFIDIANSVRGATRRVVTAKGTAEPIITALGLIADGTNLTPFCVPICISALAPVHTLFCVCCVALATREDGTLKEPETSIGTGAGASAGASASSGGGGNSGASAATGSAAKPASEKAVSDKSQEKSASDSITRYPLPSQHARSDEFADGDDEFVATHSLVLLVHNAQGMNRHKHKLQLRLNRRVLPYVCVSCCVL